MYKIVVGKVDLAIKQLETAIRLFLEEDYICAITLAGAAEEILGKLVKRTGHDAAHAKLTNRLISEYQLPISPKELNDKYLNYARNTLKHLDDVKDTVELEPQTEAISMIVRSIINLLILDQSVTYNTPDFFAWVSANRDDLLK